MHRGSTILKTTCATSTKRMASSKAASGGVGKLLTYTVIGTGATAAGVAGYASYDNDFRKKVEVNVPYSKQALEYVIGKAEAPAPSIQSLRPAKLAITQSITTSEPKVIVPKKDDIKKPEKRVEGPERNPYLGAADAEKKNEALGNALKERIQKAEISVREATEAKLETIRAVEHHIQMIREAIENGKDGDWTRVTEAHATAQLLTEKDMVKEKMARNVVADLLLETNLGAQGEKTVLNPMIPVSKETGKKLLNELDELLTMVKKVDSEKIFIREYGHLVEDSRNKFALELKAIMPDFDWQDGEKFKKIHLKTLLQHAHIRIDQLSRQIIEQKMKEEERVKLSVKDQQNKHLEQLKKEGLLIPEKDKNRFEEELARRLLEVKLAYEKKLEQVVKTQKQLYDIEHAKDVEMAVETVKEKYHFIIGKALAQLDGIEKALNGHLQMDIENRKSKQMWLAVQNLVDSVEYGRRGSCCMEGRRIPLAEQMGILKKCSGDDRLVELVDTSLSRTTKVKGEYTKEDLNNRFSKVYKIGRRVAYVEDDAGTMGYLWSWLKATLTVNLPVKSVKDPKVNPAENNITLLNRAEALWKQGKKLEAIKVLQLTRGATRRHANDFIQDARRHEEALFLSKLLLAHAALTSIRSTY